MNTAEEYFAKAAEEMGLARRELKIATEALQEHNRATQLLTKEVQASLAIPPLERIERIKDLMTEYAGIVERVGKNQEPLARSFKEHIIAAINAIEEGIKNGGINSPEELSIIVAPLKEFQSNLQSAIQHIEYFRGALVNMPDLEQPDVLAIRDKVREALRKTIVDYSDAGKQMQTFRNHLTHNA